MAETNVEVTPQAIDPIKYSDNIVRGDEDDVGIPVAEEKRASVLDGIISIPLGYEKQAKIGNKEITIFLSKRVPPVIDPDLHYPVTEWRITQDRIDDADNVPLWKQMPIMYNGQGVRNLGREVKASYYVMLAIQGMDEESDGHFFIESPFLSDKIKVTDIKLPVIKGSDILEFEKAKKTLANNWFTGATRRRGDQ